MAAEGKANGKSPVRFLITGAAGQIGYALIPLVATGQVLGADQPVILHLLDVPFAQKTLGGVVMEIEDAAYPLVAGVVATTDVKAAFAEVDYAILVGGFPRKAGMDRKDLLAQNSPIFIEQGKALNDYANRNVKVLVVANPANTNCLVAVTNAPNIPKENFSAMTRLDHNRTIGQLATKLGVNPAAVNNAFIWGNHSSTMFPDVSIATFQRGANEEKVSDALDAEFLAGPFVKTIQDRGAAVIAARGLSSALSAANAAGDAMRDWVQGTPKDKIVSMSVFSDGSYGVEKGLIYSFPVTCANGKYQIVQGLTVSADTAAAIKNSEKELLAEKADAGL